MAGILDFLSGLTGASPFGALYQDPLAQRQKAAGDLLASMGVSPTAAPQISPFDLPQPPAAAPVAPAAPAFGAGATPFGFAGPGSMNGINPAMMAAPAPAPAPIAQIPQAPAAPSTDLSSANRAAPAAADEGPDVPETAAPAPVGAPVAPSSPAPFSLAGGGDNRLMKATRGFFGNMGAGPIGALAGGLGALITGQNTDPTSIANERMSATGNALISKGASPADVQAAVNNPALMTALLQQYYGKDKFKVVQTGDTLGQKTFQLFNESDGTFKPIPGSAGGAGSGGGAGPGLLAPGVQYDPNKSGDDYMAQFSPEVQAAAKAWLKGDAIPTGNARMQSISNYGKTVGQKYAADMGIPASDSLYAEKRKYRTELGSTSPNTAGGQAKAFNQGIDHLTSLAGTLEKLDNSNGLGIPMVAQGVNALRQGVSNEQSAISDEARSLGQTVAGEVGKLFSGSAGGGVHERELTRERFDTVKSRPQLAAALQATIETMQGGLNALEQRRDQILGPDSGVDFVDNSTRQKIAQIQGVIDRLKGAGGSAAPAAAAPRLAPGQSTTINGVPIRRVN